MLIKNNKTKERCTKKQTKQQTVKYKLPKAHKSFTKFLKRSAIIYSFPYNILRELVILSDNENKCIETYKP